MRKLYFLLFILLATTAYSQTDYYVKQVIVANGGNFEFSPPYADYATIAYFNPDTELYKVFDTIRTQSVQDLLIAGKFAYLASEDSIIKYNLDTYERVAVKQVMQNVYSTVFSSSRDYLGIGKLSGVNGNIEFISLTDLSLYYAVPSSVVPNCVKGVIIEGDTAYATHNITQRELTYVDSVGLFTVIDLKNKQVVRTDTLGEHAAGISRLFSYDGKIYAACANTGNLYIYNPVSGKGMLKDDLNIKRITFISGEHLYGTLRKSDGSAGVGRIRLTDLSIAAEDTVIIINDKFPGWPGSALGQCILDTINNTYYHTGVNYTVQDTLYQYTSFGELTAQYPVGISAEVIGIDYRIDIAASLAVQEINQLSVYPNPAASTLSIAFPSIEYKGLELVITDLAGRVVISETVQASGEDLQIQIAHLREGAYLGFLKTTEQTSVFRFVKN